jgi:hypothetical protein
MGKRKRALLSILSEDDASFCGPLYCPRCGGRQVHPISVTVNPAGCASGQVEVKSDGIHLDKTARRIGISVRIVVTFGCDSGHVWAVDFVYARGETNAGLLYPSQPKPGEYEIIGAEETKG